jgi:hypothetical protein
MGAEFMVTDAGSGFSSDTTEIYLKKVLAGNIESVRVRLIAALERLGYDIIDEEPVIIGRRGARGWATWYGSADVLDYAMTLSIRLKSIGAQSTRATFDYVIKHPWLSRGEKEVLAREAEAITSLATVRAAEKVCASCATEATDDSRFCRRCGAPMTSEGAELEVFHMAAEARAGHTSVVTSAMLSLGSLAITLFAWLVLAIRGSVTPKLMGALMVLTGLLALFNFYVGLCAWGRLNRALKSKGKQQTIHAAGTPALPTHETHALPPAHTPGVSVVEGTTELLTPHEQPRERVGVPLNRERGDTGPIN